MQSVRIMVHRLGGIAQKQQLVSLGAHDGMLTAAVRSGAVIRAWQGWYSTLSDQDPALRAAKVGGRLTGMSALITRGAWAWNDHPLHVSVPRQASRLREQWDRFRRLNPTAAQDLIIHWDDDATPAGGDVSSVSLSEALRSVVLDEPVEPCRHPEWSQTGNSGTHVDVAPHGRRVWHLLDGTQTRLPEFPVVD